MSNKKNPYWDWDGEGHRGKPYPSGAAIVYGMIATISCILGTAICWILQLLI